MPWPNLQGETTPEGPIAPAEDSGWRWRCQRAGCVATGFGLVQSQAWDQLTTHVREVHLGVVLRP